VQGEGLLCGTPSTFIRVSGCNLRCAWCDTPLSSWTPQGSDTPLDELVAYCEAGPRHVVVTGGEPTLFPAVASLCERLSAASHHVTIETAGTRWLDDLRCDLVSLSPKLAHSAPLARAPHWVARHEQRRWQPEIVARYMEAYPWQLKFVVRCAEETTLAADLDEIETMLAALPIEHAARDRVLLMPQSVSQAEILEDYRRLIPHCHTRGYRLGLRLHIELFGHRPGT